MLVLLLAFFFFIPVDNVSACNLKSNARKYIDIVADTSSTQYGSATPVLKYDTKSVKKVGKAKYWLGSSDGITMTIYEKSFDKLYGKTCTDRHWRELRTTVAHEYAHHIDFNHNKAISKMIGTKDLERAAILGGEYILHDEVWGRTATNAKALKSGEKKKYDAIKRYIDGL